MKANSIATKYDAKYSALEKKIRALRIELRAARSSLDAARRIRRADNKAFREVLGELDALKKRYRG